MASLKEIAREYRDEIMDGIAWVAIWKTGRSWNAKAFWLNLETERIEDEEMEEAREIVAADPKAIFINEYYTAHMGEGKLDEIVEGIRFMYENEYNLLANNTAYAEEEFQGNRSSLFFRVMYLIGQLEEENRPTYLFIENVKNLLSVNGGWDFARLLIEMERGGYDAEWQVLNSKDFGVPQNRERCFIIGHLRGRGSAEVFPVERADREDSIQIIGHRDGYRRNTQVFAQDGITEALSTCQGGGREHHVALPCFIDLCHEGSKMTEQARCLKARYYKGASNHAGQDSGIAIPVLTPDRAEKRQNGRRFKEDGEPMFTLTGQDRHGIAIEVKEATKQGYAECRVGIDSVNFSMPNSKTRRGRVGQEIANTLDTSCNQGIFVQVSEELVVYAVWYEKYQCYIAIRKLTPKECFRLQGWTDDYFEKAEFVNSDSQLYKQAGNGVTVTVIEAMARKLGQHRKEEQR